MNRVSTRGGIHLHLKQYVAAIEDYDQVISVQPDNGGAFVKSWNCV